MIARRRGIPQHDAMATRLTGWAAIENAERMGALLSKHGEPGDGFRDDLDVEEARRIAARDPELIYLDVDEIDGAGSGIA